MASADRSLLALTKRLIVGIIREAIRGLLELAGGIREALLFVVWARGARRCWIDILTGAPCTWWFPCHTFETTGLGLLGWLRVDVYTTKRETPCTYTESFQNLTSYFEWDHSTSRGNRCFGNLRKLSGCNKLPR